MLTYSLSEAKAKFSEVATKVMAGEEVMVTKMGRPIMQLSRPRESEERPSLIGLCKDAKLYIAEDFDEWPEDIARAFGMID